jgi:NADH-quinone oxidoreductase subunit H
MSLQGIVHAQADGAMFGFEALGTPFIITQFVGFIVFVLAAQAELTQTPFDMPVAESELVTGYLTEYTGMRFLWFFILEFATAFAFAALASTMFLGGWYVPGVHGAMADVLGPIALFAKIMLLGFVIFWVRFTYPRFREDQLQRLAWKVLIPISLANIVVTGILKVVM